MPLEKVKILPGETLTLINNFSEVELYTRGFTVK